MKQTLEETIRRADALYDARADIVNVRASLRALQTPACDGEYEAAWRLGRALFFLGQEAQARDESRLYHAQGVSCCQPAALLRPQRVEAHFWLGVNLALLARVESPLKALRHVISAKRSLKRSVRLDAAYHAAGPLRVLGRLQQKLPGLLGGGRTRARANFEAAIQLFPANTVTRLYFAELCMETGDKERARLELEALLHAPPDPAWAFESARDRQLARKLLDEMQD